MADKPSRYKQNRLQQLRGFVYAAQEGSITKAAERLFLTQPSVSLQIQALERELEAVEGAAEQLAARQELGLDEGLQGRGVSIFRSPEAQHLGGAAVDAVLLAGAELRQEGLLGLLGGAAIGRLAGG